ncbi:MAG: hypothetical protein HC915_12195 [Anaerolineae bacterium]|nr:hypothetical protein [Anaerolineae bacterium]
MITNQRRVRIKLYGAQQAHSTHRFIQRVALELGLLGWVRNSEHGVVLEAEGGVQDLLALIARLQQENSPQYSIASLEYLLLAPQGYIQFETLPDEHPASAGVG